MKYTCEITNKDLFDGVLVVQARFTSEDGTKIVQDSFSTRSGQDENWLTDSIARKVKELEELDTFVETIPLGEVVLPTKTEEVITPPSSAKEEYKADLEKFNKMVQVLRQGFISQDNAEFLTLQQKLKDTFKSEYLDLF